jgi:hypothetical protein
MVLPSPGGTMYGTAATVTGTSFPRSALGALRSGPALSGGAFSILFHRLSLGRIGGDDIDAGGLLNGAAAATAAAIDA